MVRRGVMLSLLDASCWRVEVMKGGAGDFCFSPRLTLLTVKAAFSTAARTSSTSSLEWSSCFLSPLPWKRAVKEEFSTPQLSLASRSQYSCGTKASISSSRSTTMRVATDWTRPALRPFLTFFQRSGESS